MDKFGRKYKLIIEPNDGGDIIIIEQPLTIDFNVVRSSYATLNSMQIRIKNLSLETRDRIFQDRFDFQNYQRIILQAGYDQQAVIFRGNIFQANSYRQGTDIVTFIDSRDGGFARVLRKTNKTLASGKTNKAVIEALFSDLVGVDKGVVGDIDGTNRRAVVLDGNTFDLLRERTKDNVFIDFEVVNYLADDEVIDGELFLFNAATGLIGTPKRDNAYLEIETIFEPRVTMGQLVEIQSDSEPRFDGQYKVIGVEHSGTISEAIGGTCRSRFSLLVGSQLFGAFKKVGKK